MNLKIEQKKLPLHNTVKKSINIFYLLFNYKKSHNRKLKLWSRATLSNKLMIIGIDINYDSIYKIEKGRRIVKDFELAAIAKVLETTETELLKDFKKYIN